MHIINWDCAVGGPKTPEPPDHRTCMCYLNPSAMQCNDNGKCTLLEKWIFTNIEFI